MSDSMGKAVCEAASGGNEAVYEAASDGNEAELRRMIGLGGSVNWHHPGDGGFTALITATYWGHEGCFRLLLESEAIEVNATDVSLDHALPQKGRSGTGQAACAAAAIAWSWSRHGLRCASV